MITKELLSELLKTNVTDVYRRKHDGQWRYTTSTKNGDWESNSDLPVMEPSKLCELCKNWLFNERDVMFDVRYHTNSNPRHIVIMTYGKESSFYSGVNELESLLKLCNYILSKV